MKIGLHASLGFFQARLSFFETILRYIEDPKMLEALKKDGSRLEGGIFVDYEEEYLRLNRPDAAVRQFLIEKSI